jgi:hypothetical protein
VITFRPADDSPGDILATVGPPADWTGVEAPTQGAVQVPDHIDPTNPRRVYELDDPAERKYLYEIVLTDGTPADVNRLIARSILVDLWARLCLPASLRAAWETVLGVSALIDTATPR